MIRISQDSAEVKFSKGELGQVSMTIEENRLVIQEMVREINTAMPLHNADIIKECPVVVLEFYKLKSIDNLISQLLNIRRNLETHLLNLEADKLRAMVEQLQLENEELKRKHREG